MLVAGLSMTPLPTLLLAADVRYLFYQDAAGFALEGRFAVRLGRIPGRIRVARPLFGVSLLPDCFHPPASASTEYFPLSNAISSIGGQKQSRTTSSSVMCRSHHFAASTRVQGVGSGAACSASSSSAIDWKRSSGSFSMHFITTPPSSAGIGTSQISDGLAGASRSGIPAVYIG